MHTHITYIGTRVVDVDVDMVTGGVVVRCGFQDTLSVKCFVQLVSGVHGGHYEGECLEGGREASHVFTGLMPSTYTVLVYGLDSQEPSCLPSARHDYITVITVNNTSTVSTPVTPKPNTSASPPRGVHYNHNSESANTILLFRLIPTQDFFKQSLHKRLCVVVPVHS